MLRARTWKRDLARKHVLGSLTSAILPLRLVPTPNIQPNLGPLCNRECSVPCLQIPRPVGPKILPEHRIALDRLERDPFYLLLLPVLSFVALQEPTPFLPSRHLQPREVRAPALAIRVEIDHKRAQPIPASGQRARPVIMVPVVAGCIVALGPHALDENIRAPALEGARAVLQASHCVVAGE